MKRRRRLYFVLFERFLFLLLPRDIFVSFIIKIQLHHCVNMSQNLAAPDRDVSNAQGGGPTLTDPDDKIQGSDISYGRHLDNASEAVGGSPTLRNTGTHKTSTPLQRLEGTHYMNWKRGISLC